MSETTTRMRYTQKLNKWRSRQCGKNMRRCRDAHWLKVDRYIKNCLPGVLKRAIESVPALRKESRFETHVNRCAYVLHFVLAATCYYNRRLLRHLGVPRVRDIRFQHLNNGMCGMYAWVTQQAWERVRREDEGACNMVIFPRENSNGAKVRCHAFALHDGLLYDGDITTCYKLNFEWNPELDGKQYRVARVTEGDGETLSGIAVVLDSDTDKGKHWCRRCWFPWSTRRARRIVDLIVKSYEE